MKTMIRVLSVALLAVIAWQTPLIADNDKPITVSQLPAKAQQVINQNFKGKKIAVVVQDGMLTKSYDVMFTNGDKVEFDRNGNWTEVDCRRSAVPVALIPSAIKTYVTQNYPDAKVMEMEKDRSEYEVKLSTGMEITFNKNFQAIDIDF